MKPFQSIGEIDQFAQAQGDGPFVCLVNPLGLPGGEVAIFFYRHRLAFKWTFLFYGYDDTARLVADTVAGELVGATCPV